MRSCTGLGETGQTKLPVGALSRTRCPVDLAPDPLSLARSILPPPGNQPLSAVSRDSARCLQDRSGALQTIFPFLTSVAPTRLASSSARPPFLTWCPPPLHILFHHPSHRRIHHHHHPHHCASPHCHHHPSPSSRQVTQSSACRLSCRYTDCCIFEPLLLLNY
jgi:hypothetical protein